MKDPIRLKELIIQKMDMARVMKDYHVHFVYNTDVADEVQFRCPFHGKDNKPSARFYRQTQSAFCWVCRKRWDVIDFVMEMENMTFIRAILHLIKKYNIDTSSIPDTPKLDIKKNSQLTDMNIRIKCLKNRIKDLKGKVFFEKYNKFMSVYNMILFKENKKEDISQEISKLEIKLNKIKE